MVRGRQTDRIRSSSRRQHRRLSRWSGWRAPAPSDHRTHMEGVPMWSRDGQWIYFVSTCAGAIPDVWRVSPNGGEPIRVTPAVASSRGSLPDGRHLFYLDRYPGGAPIDGQADARTGRRRTRGTGARTRSAVSVGGHGHGSCSSPASRTSTRSTLYRFSDRRTARVGRRGFGYREVHAHDGHRDGRWVLATKTERLDSDLMRLDNFRWDCSPGVNTIHMSEPISRSNRRMPWVQVRHES